jgi:hypothetical protein
MRMEFSIWNVNDFDRRSVLVAVSRGQRKPFFEPARNFFIAFSALRHRLLLERLTKCHENRSRGATGQTQVVQGETAFTLERYAEEHVRTDTYPTNWNN